MIGTMLVCAAVLSEAEKVAPDLQDLSHAVQWQLCVLQPSAKKRKWCLTSRTCQLQQPGPESWTRCRGMQGQGSSKGCTWLPCELHCSKSAASNCLHPSLSHSRSTSPAMSSKTQEANSLPLHVMTLVSACRSSPRAHHQPHTIIENSDLMLLVSP